MNKEQVSKFYILLKEMVMFLLVLILYLTIVNLVSYDKSSSTSNQALTIAIGIADLLVLIGCVALLNNFRSKAIRKYFWGLILPIGVLLMSVHADYCLTRFYFFHEEGFLGSLFKIKNIILALLYCELLVMALALKAAELMPPRPHRLDVRDLLSLALLGVPLVLYHSHNFSDFNLWSTTKFFAVLMGIPLCAMFALSFVQAKCGRSNTAVPLVLSFTFVHYVMPIAVSSLRVPIEGASGIQLLMLSMFIPACIFVYQRDKNRFVGFAVSMLVLSLSWYYLAPAGSQMPMQIVNEKRNEIIGDDSKSFLSGELKKRPDIFLLIYDAYADRKMMDHYKIDNQQQLGFLQAEGFTVYPNIYTLHPATLGSISRLLDMDASPSHAIGGENRVHSFLQKNGYKTHLVLNPYILGGSQEGIHHMVYPSASPFSGADALLRGIAVREFKSELVFEDQSEDAWLSTKRTILSSETPYPKYLYSHSGMPGHSQNSGTCLADERELYLVRLNKANTEMREDIEAIRRSNRDAIIIVAGDHGPYLLGDCLYLGAYKESAVTREMIMDRYGMFLAIAWPGGASYGVDTMNILQDVFFNVFTYLTGDSEIMAHRLNGNTYGHGPVLGSQSMIQQGGIIAFGPDKGKKIYWE